MTGFPARPLDVESGTVIRISAKAYGQASQIPLRQLEIVGHSKTLKKVSAGEPGQSEELLSIEMELPVQRGIWVGRPGPMLPTPKSPIRRQSTSE